MLWDAVGLDLLQRFLELRVFLLVFRIHLRRCVTKDCGHATAWRKTLGIQFENQIRSKQIRKIEETLEIFNVFGIHFGVSYSNSNGFSLYIPVFFPPKSSIFDLDYPVQKFINHPFGAWGYPHLWKPPYEMKMILNYRP